MTAFITSLIFVVLAEMGDKTQLATIALAVKYNTIVSVWMGPRSECSSQTDSASLSAT